MRAMSGLWKEGQGRIIRPPVEQMMFLPQQPYMTLGSLRDQLLYTLTDDAAVSDERLLAVLHDVHLDTVLERVGGLDAPQREWTSILTLGEQQSLAFARLLLAEPEFAFLDEAARALPTARVRSLFKLLSRTSTTYLSVGSKELLEYHDMQLQLHGDGTWTVTGDMPEMCDPEWTSSPIPALQAS